MGIAILHHTLIRDGLATLITAVLAVSWLKVMTAIAHRGWFTQTLSRKLIHIGTGPLFVLCWNGFSGASTARYFAALVPLALTAQFGVIGLGLMDDPATIQSVTRHGNPRELLKGPLYYGIVFVVCTIFYWRDSPIGILALMLMCGGDGLADIVGRRWGIHKLPFSQNKSWVGSTAMFLGGFGFGMAFLLLFNAWGNFQPTLQLGSIVVAVGCTALASTLVEALPFQDIDNITLTLVAICLGTCFF